MPVITRSQAKKIRHEELKYMEKNTQIFKVTLESDACVIDQICSHLSAKDLINFKMLSKDSRFNDVISYKLQKLRDHKRKTDYVVKKMKNFMADCEKTKGTSKKIKKCDIIFQFLSKHKWFLQEHEIFRNVVENKLFQFIAESDKGYSTRCIEHLNTLFNLLPPSEYYDSKKGIKLYGMFNTKNQFIHI